MNKILQNKFFELETICFLCLSLILCVACSSDSSAGGSTEDETVVALKDKTITGVSQKGPFVKGSSVTVQELDGETFAQTGKSFKGKIISDAGDFKLDIKSLISQYVLIEANGYFFNEITGGKSNAPITLNAFSNIKERDNVNINLLTHLAYERTLYLVTKEDMPFSKAKKQAEQEVLKSFGIEEEFNDAEELNIFGTENANAALLAISILMQNDFFGSDGNHEGEAGLSERLTNYSLDIETDGIWNDIEIQTKIADGVSSYTLEGHKARYTENIAQWGISTEIPAFEKYIGVFWWANYGLGTCNAENEGEAKPNINELSEYHQVYYICKSGEWNWADGEELFAAGILGQGIEYGEMTDSRDGKVYKTIQIGEQTWMAENLEHESRTCPTGWRMPRIEELVTLGRYAFSKWPLSYEHIDEHWLEYANLINIGFGNPGSIAGINENNENYQCSWSITYWDEDCGLGVWSNPYISIRCVEGEEKNTADLWNGANGDYRVKTSLDNGSDKSGYWYMYSDNTSNGNSTIKWPVPVNEYDENSLYPIIDTCNGLCGTVSLGDGYDYPYVGIGFSLTGSDDTSADITGWEGLCITYTAEVAPILELVPKDEAKLTEYNNYTSKLAATFTPKTTCLNWTNFKQQSGWGEKIDQAEYLKMITAIKINFSGKTGTTGDFNIIALGKYNPDGSGNISLSSSSVNETSSSSSSVNESSSSVSVEKGTFIDSRDAKTYQTVKIGNQEWMAENLNYETENSYCYKDSTENCKKYGRLYTWEAALNACPEGYHLPTEEEFVTLISNVGGNEIAGKMLKSTTGWYEDGHGVDKYGFNVLPAGGRYGDGDFDYAGKSALFWSATEFGEDYAYILALNYSYEGGYLKSANTDVANPVRCLRGSN